MSKFHSFIGVCIVLLVFTPVPGYAQTYYYDQTTQLELLDLLTQLLHELQTQYYDSYGVYSGTSIVDVETVQANNIDENSVQLYGSIDLNGAASARVWFQYGESSSFGEQTPTALVTDDFDQTFRADIDELNEDDVYYYRAVSQDSLGRFTYGVTRSFRTDDDGYGRNDNPDVDTEHATTISETSAKLHGEVDMNDFRNGLVFFVYGEDEDQVEDIERDYDEYDDIDEDGDDLQKVRVDSDLDDEDDYDYRVYNLDENTEYFFVICVEYDDEDYDETITCGNVEDFETDDNGYSDDDEPDVETERASNIREDEARLEGEVDMNDFRNGLVFFVYGEDEDQVEDIERDYDEYDDIDEDGDDLQKVRVDSDLDSNADYHLVVRNLDDNTEHFYSICVEYRDEDNDEIIKCGEIEEFITDRD